MSFLGITAANAPRGGGSVVPPSGGDYATGGTVTDITGFKVHTFNSSGTFATTASWPSGRTIEYLVVAGGGGSNAGSGNTNDPDAGGGGAGGLLTAAGTTGAASTNYAVTIGGGGGTGANGADSSFIGGAISITSTGGGAGGLNTPTNGNNGGSGGGAGIQPGTGAVTTASGGTGIVGQGKNGLSSSSTKEGGNYYNIPGDGGGYDVGGNDPSQGFISTIMEIPATGTYTLNSGFFNPVAGTTYNFTVAAGLFFVAGQPLAITGQTTPITTTLYVYVVSYSGTTLQVVLVGDSNYTSGQTISSWIIRLTFAGGGRTGSVLTRTSINGGGAGLAAYPGITYTPVNAAPNTGGGGSQLGASNFNGGSGVVMIKYAYP